MVRRVLKRVPDAWVSVSATTRSPRPGEVDGVNYHFVSDARFDQLAETDGLLEWAQVFSNRYGTPRSAVEERIRNGGQVLLEIDVQGGEQVKRSMPEAVLIFVEPPSADELRSRLTGRGTETPEQIEQRLGHASREFAAAERYDHRVVNDDLSQAVDELIAIIDSYAEPEE